MWLLFKNLLFTLVAPGTVAALLPALIVRHEAAGPVWPAAPFFVSGIAIYAWTVWDFATRGQGTPAPIDAPRKLVTRGLYRYVRNPMYLGVLCVLLGWVLWYLSAVLAVYAAAVWLSFHLFTRFYEEPHLRKLFGAEYETYCRRVGRWLPRAPRKHENEEAGR